MLDLESVSFFYKRRLPHLFQQNHPIFITWHMKFELSPLIKNHLYDMRMEFEQSCKTLTQEYKSMLAYNYHKKVFDWIDQQVGISREYPELLKQLDIADIVQESMHFNNNKKYYLHAFCIMPNHVHVLITPYVNPIDYKKTLPSITQTWKGYTARKINQLLNREGAFWNSESYDHLVRDENEFFRIVTYIKQNPVKANLVSKYQDWQYTWVAPEITEQMLL